MTMAGLEVEHVENPAAKLAAFTVAKIVETAQHPDADPSGYVQMPNVNVVTEMVNMMTASRAYEAGVTSIESIKQMAASALRIAR